jgi:hypothetical protein
VLAAHHVLNQAIADLVRLIHLLNHQPGPDAGWDVVLLESVEVVPPELTAQLSDAMQTGDLSAADASRRRYALLKLLQSCWSEIASGEPFEDRADLVRQGRMLRDLLGRGGVSISEFRAEYDPRLLIQSPAFELVWIDRQSDEVYVRFNVERLQQLVRHDLGRFLGYQQRLLRDLAAASGTDVDS